MLREFLVIVIPPSEVHAEASAGGEERAADDEAGAAAALERARAGEAATPVADEVDRHPDLAVNAEVLGRPPLEAKRRFDHDLWIGAGRGAEVEAAAEEQAARIAADELEQRSARDRERDARVSDVRKQKADRHRTVDGELADPVRHVETLDPADRPF